MRILRQIALLALFPSAFAWAETVEAKEEMSQTKQNPGLKCDIFKPPVASQIFNDSRKLITNQPSEADLKQAFELMLQSAELNYPRAMLHVATFYSDGMGVEQNFDEAMRWYLQVAELNHKMVKVAQNNIGIMYYRGEGVTRDNTEAIKWLQRSADNGHAKAVESLKHIQKQN